MRGRQRLVAKLQQTAERATGQHAFLHFHGMARRIHGRHGNPARITCRTDRRQLGRLVAQHQRLPIANKHVVLPTVLRHHFCTHQLAQVIDQLVTLIEQVIRRLAAQGVAERGNLFVDASDLLGIGVDLIDIASDLVVDIGVEAGEVLVHGTKLVGQRLARTDELLPRRRIGGRVGDGLHIFKQRLQLRRKTGGLVGQQVVNLADLRVVRGQRLVQRLGLVELRA